MYMQETEIRALKAAKYPRGRNPSYCFNTEKFSKRGFICLYVSFDVIHIFILFLDMTCLDTI
jgi:hypothetical protein